jgi:hypothetical protein
MLAEAPDADSSFLSASSDVHQVSRIDLPAPDCLARHNSRWGPELYLFQEAVPFQCLLSAS